MPEATREMQGGHSLLDICLELHGDNTGMCEYLGGPEKSGLIFILQQAILHWEKPHPEWRAFDEAVRQLILATLAETDSVAIDEFETRKAVAH